MNPETSASEGLFVVRVKPRDRHEAANGERQQAGPHRQVGRAGAQAGQAEGTPGEIGVGGQHGDDESGPQGQLDEVPLPAWAVHWVRDFPYEHAREEHRRPAADREPATVYHVSPALLPAQACL